MRLHIFSILCFVINYSCAQVSQNTMVDSLPIPPSTTRVNGRIISLKGKTADVKVISVIGTGQGIINMLSEGQEITVQLPEEKMNLKTGETIEADLKEKMGVDASQSSYALLRIFNRKKK